MSHDKLRSLIDKYIVGIQQYYPSIDFSGSFSMYSGEYPTSAELRLGFNANPFQGTLHDLGPHPLEIAHFTNLKSAINVLESGELWLSQIDNCNDTKELIHTFEQSHLKDQFEQFNEYKKYCFITSFSDYARLTEDDEFVLWRTYGSNGDGVALVFEVDQPNMKIHSYMLGKVMYGSDNKAYTNYRDFLSFDEAFRKDYPGVIQNDLINKTVLLSLFLKTLIWQKEKEIRLLGYHKYHKYTLESVEHELDNSTLANIYHTLSNNGKHSAFIKLPLANSPTFLAYEKKIQAIDPDYSINNLLPRLKLTGLVLGYNLCKQRSGEMYTILENLMQKYSPSYIKPCRIREYF